MAAENFKVKKGLEVGTGATITSEGVNVTGIITATQFKGDGSGLTNVVGSGSGVVVKDEGSAVGTAGTINFVGSGIAAVISEGTATITVNAGGLDNVVEDTTPQLGGNLDLNSKFITGSGNIDITGSLDVSGISTFAGITTVTGETLFTKQLNVTGVSTFGNNINASGTSRFEIASMENALLDGSIDHTGDATTKIQFETSVIKLDTAGTTRLNINNSGANITGVITATGANITGIATFTGGVAKLLFNGNQKLTTTINGIEVPDLNVTGVGTVGRLDTSGVTLGTNSTTFAAKFADDAVANFGGGNDLKIYHQNSDNNSYIKNTNGNLFFYATNTTVGLKLEPNAKVRIYHAGNAKLETDQAGVKITGVCTATSFSGSGAGLTNIPSAQLSGALPALDGSALTGITASGSGIIVKHDGSTVGTAGTINFSTNLDVSAISAGIVTVTASGGSVTSDAQFNTVGGTNAGNSFSGTSANSNTLFGYDAGTAITTSDRNTFIGFEAGKAVTSGITENVFIGYKAGLVAQTSQQNVSVGSYTLQNMNHSSHKGSTAIGHYSLYTQTSGKDNCGLGRFSGYNVSEGEENVFLGSLAGYNNITTGSNNIIIGYNATGSSATVSNEITLGNSSITKLRVPGIGLTFTSIGAEVSGIITATSFSGSGASLTALNASNLGSGTIPNGRFPATLPAASGANLTSLTAGNISGTLASGQIADEAITFAKMQHVGTGVLIGRNDGGTGDMETLSAAEVRTLLNVADGATAGITTAQSNVQVVYTVTANGSSAYRFAGNGVVSTADDPDLYLIRGQKYRFINNSGGSHPFQIRVASGGSAYSTGVTNNGAASGNIDFAPTYDSPAQLVYQCTSHSGMVGNIYIRGGSGGETNVGVTTFSGGITASGSAVVSGDLDVAADIRHTGDTDTRLRFETDTISVRTAGDERLRIDSDGRLLVGHTSTQTIGSNSHGLVQLNVNSNQTVLSLARFENVAAGPSLNLGKSRSSSPGNYTVVQDDDGLGSISFAGADGTDLVTVGAVIEAQVDGTPGSNDMPGRLVFSTTPDGASSPTEKLRIDSNGMIGFGGVTPKTQNALDAIEFGLGGLLGSQRSARTVELTSNAYYNSGWKYMANDVATQYYQYNGYHAFGTAASGSADAAISFTERLRIASDGEATFSGIINQGTPGGDIKHVVKSFGPGFLGNGSYADLTLDAGQGGGTVTVHAFRTSDNNLSKTSIFGFQLRGTGTANVGTVIYNQAGSSGNASFSVTAIAQGIRFTNNAGATVKYSVTFDLTGDL